MAAPRSMSGAAARLIAVFVLLTPLSQARRDHTPSSDSVSQLQKEGTGWGTEEEADEVRATELWGSVAQQRSGASSQNAAFMAHLGDLARADGERKQCSGRHAYVIAGTTSEYATGACTVAKLLRDEGAGQHGVDFISLHDGDQHAAGILNSCGQFDRVVNVDTTKIRQPGGYYHDVGVKLAAFGDTTFNNSYDRIIALDADLHPMKNLDFLFCASPEYDLFFPRAYWINPDFGMGAFYAIKPREETFASMVEMWNSPSQNGQYPPGEMDVVNDFYHKQENRDRMAFLPANFLVLDSHWHLQEERNPPNANPFPGSLDNIYTIHFSGYGKPWMHSEEDDLAHFSQDFHPAREKWWRAHKAVQEALVAASLSGLRQENVGHRTGAGLHPLTGIWD